MSAAAAVVVMAVVVSAAAAVVVVIVTRAVPVLRAAGLMVVMLVLMMLVLVVLMMMRMAAAFAVLMLVFVMLVPAHGNLQKYNGCSNVQLSAEKKEALLFAPRTLASLCKGGCRQRRPGDCFRCSRGCNALLLAQMVEAEVQDLLDVLVGERVKDVLPLAAKTHEVR